MLPSGERLHVTGGRPELAPPEPETPAVSVFRPGLPFPSAYPVDASARFVPAGLEGRVRLEPAAIGFTRTSTSRGRALSMGLVGVGLMTVPVVATWLALGLMLGEVAMALAVVGSLPVAAIAALLLPLLAFFTLTDRVEWVVGTAEGLGGRDGFTWTEGDRLDLAGDPATAHVRLVRIDARGTSTILRTWNEVHLHRSHGWDLGTIRWFATQFATIARVPLHMSLPDDPAWHRVYQGRVVALQLRRMRMHPKFARLLEVEPLWPEETWGPDGATLTVSGRMPHGFTLPPGISFSAKHTLRVGPDGVRIRHRTLPLDRIQEVQVWFGEVAGDPPIVVGQVVALTSTGITLLLQRELTDVDPGVLLGAAAALTNAIDVARRAPTRAPVGSDVEVPDALRRMIVRHDPSSP